MDIIIAGLPLAAFCGVVVEFIKRVGLPNKYAALLSVAIGMVLMWALTYGDASLLESLAAGFLAGATASGVYSGSKAIVSKK